MAISRAQLLKEILPGLDKLFSDQYFGDPATWFTKKAMDTNVHNKEVFKIPINVLYDIWLARYGENVSSEVLRNDGVLGIDDYMGEVGVMLSNHGYLVYNHTTKTFTLNEEQHYAHPRQQGSTV